MVLEEKQIDRIDGIAERFKITRSEATRRLLEVGLDVYETYEKLGVVKLSEIVKRSREACAKSVQPSLF